MKTAFFLSSFLVLLSVQAGERLVGRTDYDQPAEWARKPFLGRDFFPLLSGVYWAAVGAKDVPEGYSVYTESGLRIGGPLPKGVNDLVPTNGRDVGGNAPQGYARLLPEAERRKEPYRLWDFFKGNNKDRAGADRLYGTDWIDRPFLLSLGGERPAFRLNAAYPLADRADFADFHAKHPNHMGNYAMMEFDSDLAFYFVNFPKTTDGEALVRLEQAFPCTFKDWAWDANIFDRWIDEAKRRSVEFYFGDDNLWGFTSGTPGLIPLYARAGFKGVCYEATTQGGHANWRYAAAFLRGAARQFGMAYGWYTANFYDGVKRGSEKIEAGENAFGPVKVYKAFGLNRGASYEIIDRQNAYGWLIGARFVEPENWYHYHMQPVGDGRKAPSAAAKDFQALYDLSKREDRGLAYAPLALLMPIHEKVQNGGSQLYFTGFRQSAALATLVPSCSVRDFRKKGIEGGFYNSEFGEIFDIVSADATNDVDRTLAALRPYKAAALFGRFRPKDVAPAAFTRYAEEGGTLFVSEEYVAEGVVESAATGVTFPGRRILAAGEELVDDRGRRLPFKEPYVIRVGEPTTAKVLWTDEKGQPVAYVNRVGKGRVITVAVDGMLPEGGWTQSWGIPDAARHNKEFSRIYHGEVTFELMRAVFRRIQEETMPFAVAGDIHWGVNRTKDGWLVWMFNNKGITNYIDEAPVVDRGCDATVTVRPTKGVTVSSVREIRSDTPVAVSADGFTVTVPAGGWAAYAIGVGDDGTAKVVLAMRPKAKGASVTSLPVACTEKSTVSGEAPSLLPDGREFRLVWNDEFNGTQLDTSKWGYRTNFWGQRFAAFAGPEDGCVEVKDGKVHLKLKKRADGHFCSPQLQTGELLWDYPRQENGTGFWPLAKREKPKFVHRYGYYEARFRLQRHPGWWSAFWMQSETQGTCLDSARAGIEHDIMESFYPGDVGRHMFHMNGYGPDYVGYSIPREANATGLGNLDLSTGEFHTFGLLWEPDGYTVFVDGRRHGEKTDPAKGEAVSQVPEFILISTECQWYRSNRMTGTAVAELEESARQGDDFVVDFVRVYDIVR